MLPKAPLTSYSRMSGSRWMITPLWLSGSWRSLLYSSVYSCHLFLISSASVRSIPFLSFIEPIFAWNIPLVSLIILKRSLVFPIILFSSISLHWYLRKAFLSLLSILWNSAFNWVYLYFSLLPFASLLFSTTCKASSDNHFALLHFFFLGMVLISAYCTMSKTSVHGSSGTLSDLVPWICLSLPLYNCKGFKSYLNGLVVFPTFFNVSLNLAIRSSWSEPQSDPCLFFCWLYKASPSLAAKNIINLISLWPSGDVHV